MKALGWKKLKSRNHEFNFPYLCFYKLETHLLQVATCANRGTGKKEQQITQYSSK